jgi:hypothetical protein
MSEDCDIPLVLHFRRRSNGRYSVKSPDLPGLFLASDDIDALKRDIDTVIRDLFYFNKSVFVDDVHWHPSKDAAFEVVGKLAPETSSPGQDTEYTVTLQRAA